MDEGSDSSKQSPNDTTEKSSSASSVHPSLNLPQNGSHIDPKAQPMSDLPLDAQGEAAASAGSAEDSSGQQGAADAKQDDAMERLAAYLLSIAKDSPEHKQQRPEQPNPSPLSAKDDTDTAGEPSPLTVASQQQNQAGGTAGGAAEGAGEGGEGGGGEQQESGDGDGSGDKKDGSGQEGGAGGQEDDEEDEDKHPSPNGPQEEAGCLLLQVGYGRLSSLRLPFRVGVGKEYEVQSMIQVHNHTAQATVVSWEDGKKLICQMARPFDVPSLLSDVKKNLPWTKGGGDKEPNKSTKEPNKPTKTLRHHLAEALGYKFKFDIGADAIVADTGGGGDREGQRERV
ncbi:unnamed protein product [Vitrella brassicaformis CCMP3155]|uniref:Uncharacterized protein n=1 Tax=Vitrella brassicaformis (strain CCMP3155) TaxID=1169540 RepID=A0A0G4F939_VITBC|nr:unnamed protein product [Vitrella brassicaformis CCMP3155]|eukprot:CEM08870.1 unnamed protein product [Vitrella brassicaformis CCMP3155]